MITKLWQQFEVNHRNHLPRPFPIEYRICCALLPQLLAGKCYDFLSCVPLQTKHRNSAMISHLADQTQWHQFLFTISFVVYYFPSSKISWQCDVEFFSLTWQPVLLEKMSCLQKTKKYKCKSLSAGDQFVFVLSFAPGVLCHTCVNKFDRTNRICTLSFLQYKMTLTSPIIFTKILFVLIIYCFFCQAKCCARVLFKPGYFEILPFQPKPRHPENNQPLPWFSSRWFWCCVHWDLCAQQLHLIPSRPSTLTTATTWNGRETTAPGAPNRPAMVVSQQRYVMFLVSERVAAILDRIQLLETAK